MKKQDVLLVLKLFLGWRLLLFFAAFIATIIIPWGEMFPYSETTLAITGLPNWIWSFGNFDGVHYLKIAQEGYLANSSQAFFPAFPLLIKTLNFFPRNETLDLRIFVDPTYFYTGIVLSNLFFFFALVFLYKLFSLDWNRKTVISSILLLLIFPSSFYFGAIYTESLFLLAVVGSLYFARKQNFVLAGIFAFVASATKIVGVVMFPVLLIELFQTLRNRSENIKTNFKKILGVLLAPLGLLFYMFFLKINFNNPFYFITSQPSFGAARSAMPTILLPQVIYRYIKIFLNVPLTSRIFITALTEFIFSIVSISCALLLFRKVRFSYWFFTVVVLIIPTLTGTFLSMPRFILMTFLLFPYIVKSKFYLLILVIFLFLLILFTMFFTRGYWVA